MSSLQKSVLKSKLPPIVPSAPLQSRGARRGLAGRRRDYTPVQWDAYFTENEDIRVNNNKFRVYKLGTTGPVLMLLHGGGFSALTWSLFSASVTGMVECRVVAMDLRGHGDTVTEEEEDLSAETMAKKLMHNGRSFHTCGAIMSNVIRKGHAVKEIVDIVVEDFDELDEECDTVDVVVLPPGTIDALTDNDEALNDITGLLESIGKAECDWRKIWVLGHG
ncbi:Protein phosphatase methylesterase 1, partial [Gryllus bimaculatus]